MTRIAAALAVALFGAVTLGCSLRAAPPRTYVLSPAVPPTAPMAASPGSAAASPGPVAASTGRGPVVGVGPVAIPAYLDRQPIVVRAAGDEVRLSSNHHWAEPMRDGVARVIAENLSAMVPTDAVVVFPWRSPWTVRYRVTLEILRFDGPLGGPVVLNARWRLLDGESKELVLKAATLSEPATDATHGALVAAQGRLLAALSREIAAEIRQRGA
jgi:uncharacterized lipoprotein YmbA